MTSRFYRTEAIILKASDFGEADRLFTLLTPEFGKLRAIAKGVKKPQSHLGGHIQVLSHCLLLLVRGKTIDIITQSQVLNFFLPLREQWERLSWASHILKLTETLALEGVESWGLFRLLLSTLEQLCVAKEGQGLVHYFEIALLSLAGYRPELNFCLGCHLPVSGKEVYFSGRLGGVLCSRCHNGEAIALSPAALKIMRFWQQTDINHACRLKLSPSIEQEIATILKRYLQHQGLAI